MKNIRTSIYTVALALLCFSAGSPGLSAQPHSSGKNDKSSELLVQVIDHLRFYSLGRTESRTVGFLDAHAAKFTIDAEPERTLVLAISTDRLEREEEVHEGGPKKITLDILPEDCGYSIDNGVTWIPFSGTIHHQQIVTPKAPLGESTCRILVRVGGTIEAHHAQRRGYYEGHVSLGVEYHQ